MPSRSALDDQLRRDVARIGRADVVVGIPSFRNPATIGHVASTVARGLREHFGSSRVAIVNADGGSEDGTPDRAREGAGDVPLASGRYVGPSGKGSAFRAIFEAAGVLGARACAVVDSDLRSITPEWIARLVGPVVRDEADYVTPLYARHKHDGTITNTVAYPLTRALYGLRVRQPIGGEFGFRADLAPVFLAQDVWAGDVARFGIDIFMTTTALARGSRVVQAFLGAKVHDPKDPAADLGPMFTQVVGTLFRLAARYEDVWTAVAGSRPAPVVGEIAPVEPEPIGADPARLRAKLAATAGEYEQAWAEVLSEPVPATLDPDSWARVVFDFLAAALRDPDSCERLARALLPLYYARVADFLDEARDLTTAQAEDLVEAGALAMEKEKQKRATSGSRRARRGRGTA